MKKMKRKPLRFLLVWLHAVLSCSVWAGSDVQAQLQAHMEAVQSQAAILQYQVQYPESTRVQLAVSVTKQADYVPVKITASIDGKELVAYTYSSAEIEALKSGGVQVLWLGNLAAGDHQLTARVDGLQSNGKLVQFNTKLSFKKEQTAKVLELQIKEEVGDSPSFNIRDGGNE